MAESEEPRSISLKIKSTSQTFDINVNDSATVAEVKEVILTKIDNATKEQLCLIFSGKILKDNESLAMHKIQDNMAIHLVVRQIANRAATDSNTPQAQEQSTAASSAPNPNQASNTGAATGPAPNPMDMFGGMGMGGMNAGNMQGMAQQMMSNPDMMRQMMDNPMMQSILGNPDVMRGMLANNPQIQNIIERNPEVGHILNDPDVMRQTMEMMRNPNMFQEMMRNHDLAIRNLQGIPGGEAALQRLYQDVQEPLLNSATGSLGGNPYAADNNAANDDVSSRSQRAGVENSEALPNPWGGGGQQRAAAGANGSNDNTSGGTGSGSGGRPAGMSGNFMDSLQQMMRDPSYMQSVMNPQAMDMFRQQMQQNPQLMQQIMESNPLVQSNPELSEQMRAQMPQLMNMLGRPEITSAMTNPRVLEAIQQIQQGTDTIRREAPELARTMFGLGTAPGAAASRQPAAATQPQNTSTGTGNTTGAAPNANPMAAMMNNPEMMNMMSRMMGMNLGGAGGAGAGAIPPVANPEVAYAAQLEQLANMGFNNRAQNIAALQSTFGDLNAAVERLLNQ